MAAFIAALQRSSGIGQGDKFAAIARIAVSIRPLWAYSVEKLRCGKNPSEFWNTVLASGRSANQVPRIISLQKNVAPKSPLSASHRVFQRNRLGAVMRRCCRTPYCHTLEADIPETPMFHPIQQGSLASGHSADGSGCSTKQVGTTGPSPFLPLLQHAASEAMGENRTFTALPARQAPRLVAGFRHAVRSRVFRVLAAFSVSNSNAGQEHLCSVSRSRATFPVNAILQTEPGQRLHWAWWCRRFR